jgi:hypothetical protein
MNWRNVAQTAILPISMVIDPDSENPHGRTAIEMQSQPLIQHELSGLERYLPKIQIASSRVSWDRSESGVGEIMAGRRNFQWY